ncbi:MAG: holo-ACP synthase [Planctomycetes bacterium]|nr:holo-ACP synthase [Planctomycetota bacterium]
MHAIAHGVDIIEVARIRAMLDEHGDRFLERVFTKGESDYCTGVRRPERLAARFAAKEAVMKALGTGLADGVSWQHIEVVSRPTGEPTVVLSGEALRVSERKGIASWLISLSHVERMAIASVIGVGEARED